MVGVFCEVSNQIAHYHVFENLIVISLVDGSRLHTLVGWYTFKLSGLL